MFVVSVIRYVLWYAFLINRVPMLDLDKLQDRDDGVRTFFGQSNVLLLLCGWLKMILEHINAFIKKKFSNAVIIHFIYICQDAVVIVAGKQSELLSAMSWGTKPLSVIPQVTQ